MNITAKRVVSILNEISLINRYTHYDIFSLIKKQQFERIDKVLSKYSKISRSAEEKLLLKE